MQSNNGIISKARSLIEEITLYWNHPRPGEYVTYKEIVMLSIGWLAQYFVVQFSIGFSVGTAFAGATLGMNNNELLIMNYVTQIIGYLQAPVNAWLTDNLRSKHGKYRVYIRLAIDSGICEKLAYYGRYTYGSRYDSEHSGARKNNVNNLCHLQQRSDVYEYLSASYG